MGTNNKLNFVDVEIGGIVRLTDKAVLVVTDAGETWIALSNLSTNCADAIVSGEHEGEFIEVTDWFAKQEGLV
jgi:photosystem II stability/assembly factor-like uncharacterized protein